MFQKLSSSSFIFIWFAAAVSLAEILTGTFLAPLGFEQGLLAIIIGHLIGGSLFFLAAYIGARTGKSAMDTVKLSFGKRGSILFSVSNIVQLLGWTAIMIVSGAAAASYLAPQLGQAIWCLIIGALIIVWIIFGVRHISRLQTFAAILLFGLTLVMSATVFPGGNSAQTPVDQAISFGAAVELSAAMPLSWLPVVSDYTSRAKKPLGASVASAIAYFFGSSWMFSIGLGAALFTGSSDIAVVLAASGLGVAGIAIAIFSTVTTTFLDAASVGFSAQSISDRLDPKRLGILAAAVGTLLAIFAPVARFEEFLYLIGSIFAPMIAILIVDYLIFRNDSSAKNFNIVNLLLWLGGFILYRFSMSWDIPIGNTLPVLIIVALIASCIHLGRKAYRSKTRQ